MKRTTEIKAIVIAALATMLSAFLVSFLFASCSRELNFPREAPAGDYLSFNATLDDAATKTYLDGVQVKWENADKVALWYGTLNTEMTRADYHVGSIGDDARHATLNGFAQTSADYISVYPLSAALDCSKKGKVTIDFPVKQEIRSGSFASGANVSVAYSNTTDLSFKNIGGLLALKVSTTGGHLIKEIRLVGTSAMAGEVEIKQASIAAGEPAVDKFNEGVNFLTLDCGDGLEDPSGVSFSEGFSENEGNWGTSPKQNVGSSEIYLETPGTWESTKAASGSATTKAGAYSGDFTYYLVSLPGTHTGFALTFVDSDGKTAVAKSSHSFEITRNSNTLIADISLPDDKFKDSPKVYINEIHTHNNQIELWNPNDFSVDLTGWLLVKDEKSWAFPVGSVIPAKGYKVVTAGQTDCADGPMFGISGDKGFVLSLVSGTTVDCIDNSGEGKKVIGTTETYGRKTDGSNEWVIFTDDGTIYESGVCDGDNSKGTIKGDEPATATVVLNEINGNDKYAELYNRGAETVDMTGWTLHKDDSKVWTASDESQLSLAPGAYMVINFVKKSKDPKEAASGLSAGKTVKVELKDKSGASVDVFTRGAESTGWGDIDLPEHEEWSFSRVPNGTGAWKYALPTKGAENGPATGTIEQYPAANGGVILNELNGNDKFIELYNTSTDYPISLEDMTLYKDDGTEAIWTGAPGYAVAPGGYVLLYSEDVIDKYPGHDSGLVFTSGLSPKKTLKIELRDAAGTSLDIFTRGEKGEGWGAKIPECTDSYGRTPDGTGSWKLIDKTPGSANGDSKGDIPQN